MTYPRYIILAILSSSLLSACSLGNSITVNNDRSAHVQANCCLDYPRELQKLTTSNLIYDLDTFGDYVKMPSYKIRNIDSLGQFMPIVIGDSISFSLNNDTLVIMDIITPRSKIKSRTIWHWDLTISFEEPVQIQEIKGARSEKINANTVRVYRSKRSIKKGKDFKTVFILSH